MSNIRKSRCLFLPLSPFSQIFASERGAQKNVAVISPLIYARDFLSSEASLKLKKLKLFGYKSFAERTEIEFDGGITCVVGPNGCGKSNISDGFRWGLGEQSAKSMRGGRMTDVIFAGTTTRKPLNMAEVTITLSDVSGDFPTEQGEIAVTRRLYRNGESEYFINKHQVRLKDVHELFLDSGIGKNAFCIFEQGKIDQVINYSPLERRYIFEEAAGIVRFLQRKKEALKKLELADQNTNRVRDIHREVEKQIVTLEAQAEKAREFKQNRELLEKSEKCYLVGKWDQIQKKKEEISNKLQEQQIVEKDLFKTLEATQENFQKSKVDLEQTEENYRKKREELFEKRSQKEIQSREKSSQQERIKEAVLKEKKWASELEELLKKREARQKEFSETRAQLSTVTIALQTAEESLAVQKNKKQSIETSIANLRHEQAVAQQNLLNISRTEQQLLSEMKQDQVRMENIHEKIGAIEQNRQRQKMVLQELQKQLAEKRAQSEELSKEIDLGQKALKKLEETLLELNDKIKSLAGEEAQQMKALTECRARHKLLLKLREEMEGFSVASKKLLQASKNPQSAIHNKLKGLFEVVHPEKGAEGALAAALRHYDHTLAVETIEDLKLVLAYAKEHQLQEYSLVCLELLPKAAAATGTTLKKKVKGATGLVSHVVLSNDVLENVDWSELKQNDGTEMWFAEGAFLDRSNVLFVSRQGEKNVFMREAEIQELSEKIEAAEKRVAEVQAASKSAVEKRDAVAAERMEMDKAGRRLEMKLVEHNYALQRLNNDFTKVSGDDVRLEVEIKTLQATFESLKLKIEEHQQKVEAARLKTTEVQQLLKTLETNIKNVSEGYVSDQNSYEKAQETHQKAIEEHRKMTHQLKILELQDTEASREHHRLTEELGALRTFQAESNLRTIEYDKVLVEVETILKQVETDCQQLEKELQQKRKTIETVEARIKELDSKHKAKEKELYQFGMQSEQQDASLAAVSAEMQERFELDVLQAKDLGFFADRPLDIIEKEIRALRHEIQQAGDVNMTSIDECEVHKERHKVLKEQIDDLSGSREELLAIINELDGESRKIFTETFGKIRENFQKNFQILFNGGEADLELLDTKDVLEAGIEISAKPPGKQMRSIQLLSGGEKCLTAMALLFAIFEVKPSPFCILDEIDAPLDDANVERFVRMLQQFLDRCQFVVITHNKRTMAIADRLFGVSMEEKGVSKLLSIQFSDEQAAQPELVAQG
jgi:chromosome segregation protein